MTAPNAPMGPPNAYLQPHPEKKKSWFARHKILTAILAVAVVIIIATALGGGGDKEKPSAAPTSSSEQTSANESTDQQTSEATSEEESSAAPETPGLNTPVKVGVFEITVTAVESGIESIGKDFTKVDAQGQFVRVKLTVKNTGEEGKSFDTSEQHLIDDSDRQHDYSSEAVVVDQSLFFDKINPGNMIEGTIVYDIPADATAVAIDLAESFLDDKPVRVNLK